MASDRPLPTVIGPTENALRAVLTETLSSTRISSYQAWVVLNATSSADPAAPRGSWHRRVADALDIEPGDVLDVIGGLHASQLLDDDEAITDRGAAELAAGRSAVAATTLRLVDGISDAEQDTARVVLDRIRSNAEALLGRRGSATQGRRPLRHSRHLGGEAPAVRPPAEPPISA